MAEAAAVGVPSELGEQDILVVVGTVARGRVRPLRVARLLRGAHAVLLRSAITSASVSELPRNVVGRVRKDLLRAAGIGQDSWDREAHGYVLRR